jgi:hypothetical protein
MWLFSCMSRGEGCGGPAAPRPWRCITANQSFGLRLGLVPIGCEVVAWVSCATLDCAAWESASWKVLTWSLVRGGQAVNIMKRGIALEESVYCAR